MTNLRSDLFKLFDWSKDWQMLFNVGKCKVMHFGIKNKQSVYEMGGINLGRVDAMEIVFSNVIANLPSDLSTNL